MNILSWITEFVSKKFAPQPGIDLDQVDFAVKPYIVQQMDKYFLCYQIAKASPPALVHVLYARKSSNKAYYFFSVPISHFEPGVMVKRDISIDDFISFAKSNNIYWLNKNGTEIHLQIRKE